MSTPGIVSAATKAGIPAGDAVQTVQAMAAGIKDCKMFLIITFEPTGESTNIAGDAELGNALVSVFKKKLIDSNFLRFLEDAEEERKREAISTAHTELSKASRVWPPSPEKCKDLARKLEKAKSMPVQAVTEATIRDSVHCQLKYYPNLRSSNQKCVNAVVMKSGNPYIIEEAARRLGCLYTRIKSFIASHTTWQYRTAGIIPVNRHKATCQLYEKYVMSNEAQPPAQPPHDAQQRGWRVLVQKPSRRVFA